MSHLAVMVNTELDEHVDCWHIIVQLSRVSIRWGSGESGAKDQSEIG